MTIGYVFILGKTFPSLVVVARPYLRSKETSASDRASLDTKVKSVLVHTPMKFTEWLIQQGLVRSEQWCAIHRGNKLKLGTHNACFLTFMFCFFYRNETFSAFIGKLL